MGVCGIFRSPVQGGSNELISKFLSSMILYNHSSYFKTGEINSCRLSPLPSTGTLIRQLLIFRLLFDLHFSHYFKNISKYSLKTVGSKGIRTTDLLIKSQAA